MKHARFPLFVLVVFVGLTSVNWSPEEVGLHLADPAALKSHGTRILPALDESIPPGQNALWCATFQMAWDSAASRFGRPLVLQPGCKLMDSLNQSPFDLRWVDEASAFQDAGRVGDGVLTRIDAGVQAKTGHPPRLLEQLKSSAKPDDLVFFAMLHKVLKFENPFGKLGTVELGGRQVPWFGFTPEQQKTGPLRQQVRVHHYGAKNDFVIELRSKETGDQLLLAKLPAPPKTPGEVSQSIIKRLQADAPVAERADLLAVPNIVADESVELTELEGRKVAGKPWVLRQALQMIEFRMNEKGVKLHSEASISFGCSVAPALDNPRLLILDPPFAVVMKRNDAPQAYFVAWFANADLLGAE